MIEVKKLKKSFSDKEVLKGLSFSIKSGEFYGLLGPNGAGKTTTISILSSLLPPDSGEIQINDLDLKTNTNKIKSIIGVVPQEIALYNELSAMENLKFWGGLYNISGSELNNRAKELLQLVGLENRKDEKVKDYSGGMKRRINIAAALIHKPKILFMDEPTVGIDPQSRNLIYEIIEKQKKEGVTIIYTTHYMEEAERFCDRIAIIDEGKIIAEGTMEELKKDNSISETIAINFSKLSENNLTAIQEFWKEINVSENLIRFYSSDVKNDLPRLITYCNQLGLEIINIEILKINLETIFLNLTGKQLRD